MPTKDHQADNQTDLAVHRVRHPLKFRLLQVKQVRALTPHLIRVTFTGEDLHDFVSASFDDHLKVFFPEPGADKPVLPEAGHAYTAEEQQACQPDAMRLCGNFIPDVDRITACMVEKKSQLSPECRRFFRGGEPAASAAPAGDPMSIKPATVRKSKTKAKASTKANTRAKAKTTKPAPT